MKILFLGTGAADWPLTRPAGKKEFRRLSSAILDRTLLIDPGPQVLEALEEQRIPLASVRYVINTHSHGDHFCAATLAALEEAGAQFLPIPAGTAKQLGPYTVRAYAGNHGTCRDTVHFLISDGEKSVFYGLDGAWLLYDEVAGIREHRPDLVVLDATVGFVDGDYRIFEHNNLYMVLEMKKTLCPWAGRFCISHMARTLHTEHAQLEEAMSREGILTAFDGMEILL